MFQHNPSIKFT